MSDLMIEVNGESGCTLQAEGSRSSVDASRLVMCHWFKCEVDMGRPLSVTDIGCDEPYDCECSTDRDAKHQVHLRAVAYAHQR
jgi:hypothetical protein